MTRQLYTFFRSSTSYRMRIALAYKRLGYEPHYISLPKMQHREAGYRHLNPQGLVPLLVEDEQPLIQSLAIIEYLDETIPQPPLLPGTAAERARVRGIAQAIACDIHPIDNLRVLRYLLHTVGVDEAKKDAWYKYWIDVGLEALEKSLSQDTATGRFCHGDTPTLADIVLVPQLANARRVEMDLTPYPTLTRIESNCRALPAFAEAAPANQPDAEP